MALGAMLFLSVVLTGCVGRNVDVPAESESPSVETPAAMTEAEETPAETVSGMEETSLMGQSAGQVYLYGEMHGDQKIIEKEFEVWKDYYGGEGLRHMFIEAPYYTAEYLNLWMEADSDEILDEVYDDWEGSAAHNPYLKEFYQNIKRECPETVFHGTDVGHCYDTTGERYLSYLRENKQEDSEPYALTQECMEQGKYFYDNSDDVYRENKMVENFVNAFEALDGESIVGFYGGAHVGLEAMEFSTGSIPCMANQLHALYGDAIHSEDLTWVRKDIEPERIDMVTVAGKEYQAAYYGKVDLTGFDDFAYQEYWRLENAYDDFKDMPKTGDVLPYDNFPMLLETGQVFRVEVGKADGTVLRGYYRSDGNEWQGRMTTEEFRVE